jgi:Ribonuclease G/E
MARRLIIDCGAAETRAALIGEEEAAALWFGPACGDEAAQCAPRTGDRYFGRIRTVSKALGGAFVDIGSGGEGFIPSIAKIVEGALVSVAVRRPPIGAKSAVLSLEGPAPASAAIGLAGPPQAAPLAACQALLSGGIADIRINDAEGARQIGEAYRVKFEPQAASALDFDEVIVDALDPNARIDGGARLTFAETEAGVMIDVDAGGIGAASQKLVNDRVNLAALARLPGEIGRRGLGGRIVIDFLPPSGPVARTALQGEIDKAFSRSQGVRSGRLQRDGFFDLTLPKRNKSLLMQVTEDAGDGFVVKGRRFTLDWATKSAIRTLEKLLRARPSSRPKLIVGAAIDDYLRAQRPKWIDRLASRHGERFEIVLASQLDPRAHDVIE